MTTRSTSRTSAMSLPSSMGWGRPADELGRLRRSPGGQSSRASARVPAADMRSAPSQPQGPTRADSGRLSRLVPWALRAVWAALPLAAGPRLAAALDPRSAALRSVASVWLWAGWAAVLVATLVPHPRALTTVRMGVAGGATAVGAAVVSHPRPVAGVIVA